MAAIDEAIFPESARLGGTESISQSPWIVMKIGGSTLASADRWETLARLISNRLQEGLQPVVIVSALKGTTNLLEQIAAATAYRFPDEELDVLRQFHAERCSELGLDGRALLEDLFSDLERRIRETVAGQSDSVPARAATIAYGELLAARICTAYLRDRKIAANYQDARTVLTSHAQKGKSEAQNYYAAMCGFDPDPDFARRLGHGKGAVVIEGYIASNKQGETVLLGREGSDTSASYVAAMLGARRVEIWTDVPGLFSTDPQLVPSARLLVALSYDEAQELSAAGSRVLHPHCIEPLRAARIPLFVRCIEAPLHAGSTVSAATRSARPHVKGIAVKTGVTLVCLESSSMWQEVGFLSRAFRAFADHRVSVDLVATSQSSVVVSVDATDGFLTDADWRALTEHLEQICEVTFIECCAIVSLIGHRIRAAISSLAPAFAFFEEEKIHLISQAANDLNFSFAIDQEILPKIITGFHAAVIGDMRDRDVFGPTWEGMALDRPDDAPAETQWWRTRLGDLLEIANREGYAYVYDAESIKLAANSVAGLQSVDRCLYAMKANFNPQVLRIIAEQGIDFDCVSPAEVHHLRDAVPGIGNERILLTLNFAPRDEYEWAIREGLQITLDNLYPLQAWPEIFDGQRLFVRMDPGRGRGHHDHVRTGGAQSKFGIPLFEVEELITCLDAANATVIGVHAHSGSGIYDPHNWHAVAAQLVQIADRFPDAGVLDLGGGIGVPERPGDKAFDLETLDELLADFRDAHPGYSLWLEPGRFLVAAAGVLLARVTQTKGKGDFRYVGVNTGMNSLIRPALYGAYHEIFNLSRIDEPATVAASVVGPICESGDKLGSDRLLPECRENDIMLIANTGAYGHVMSSRYNLRETAREIVLT